MDIISFNEASTANERVQRINANPDSDSGIVTVPKKIEAGETITVPAGRVAILPNVVVDGTLVVDGEVFVPSGGKLTEETKVFFTAAQGQDTFITDYPIGFVDVYVNGIRLVNTDYTATNGTSVLLTEGLNAGDVVEIVAFGTFEVANTYTKGEADVLLADKAGVSYVDEEIANLATAAIPRPTKASPTSILVDGVELTIASPVAGTDYYFSKTTITTTPDADTIGGFHYGLVPHAEAPTGNKTEADMVLLRGINAHSIWTKWFRPVASPKGMVFVKGRWYDIYLCNSEHITNGTSKAGATIAGGALTGGRLYPKIPLEFGGDNTLTYGSFKWFHACEIAKANAKQLIDYAEFQTIAYGVQEGVDASAVDGDGATVEHYDYLTSKWGIEQASGTQWIWGNDLANGYGTTSLSWQNVVESRGQIYATSNAPVAVILGGRRGDGVVAGSRASNWYCYVWGTSWGRGCRFACDHLEVN